MFHYQYSPLRRAEANRFGRQGVNRPQRLRDISGVRLLLEEPPPTVAPAPRPARWPLAIATLCVLAALAPEVASSQFF